MLSKQRPLRNTHACPRISHSFKSFKDCKISLSWPPLASVGICWRLASVRQTVPDQVIHWDIADGSGFNTWDCREPEYHGKGCGRGTLLSQWDQFDRSMKVSRAVRRKRAAYGKSAALLLPGQIPDLIWRFTFRYDQTRSWRGYRASLFKKFSTKAFSFLHLHHTTSTCPNLSPSLYQISTRCAPQETPVQL